MSRHRIFLEILFFFISVVQCVYTEDPEKSGKCSKQTVIPMPMTSPVKNPGHTSMWVTRTDTPNPFWIALPTEVRALALPIPFLQKNRLSCSI